MKAKLLLLSLVASVCWAADPPVTLRIDMATHGASVSSGLHGIFFEEINHAGDGGLYAELIQNRSFEDTNLPEGYVGKKGKLYPKKTPNHLTGRLSDRVFRWYRDSLPGWNLEGKGATMRLTRLNPKFQSAPTNMNVHLTDKKQSVSLVNSGYWGMNFKQGEEYLLRVILRVSKQYRGKVKAKLLSHDGKVLAKKTLVLKKNEEWNDLQLNLMPVATDGKGKFALTFEGGIGDVWVDYVSLFPKNTFKGRENGLRQDLAQVIADMKPAFVRWPGGSIVGGITLADRYRWKNTMGDPAARPGQLVRWGYTTTGGLGYKEMLDFCEDLGAKAMFVCNCSLADQFGYGEAAPRDSVNSYIKECMDAIDYALGGNDTEWGRRRIAEGHPKPYPLGYVEVGNENWGDEYDKRFDFFYRAIKAQYPELKIVSNNTLWGNKHQERPDLLDPHFYGSPKAFLANISMLDSLKRTGSEVYYGEYACNGGRGEGNLRGSLADAAFVGGMERNGDLVTMASYAPLLRNQHVRHWPVNLIHFTSDSIMLRSAYYVQKMASENIPTYNVKNVFSDSIHRIAYPEGCIQVDTANPSFDVRNLVCHEDKNLKVMRCKILRKEYAKKGLNIYFATDSLHKRGYYYNLGAANGMYVSPGIIGGGNIGINGIFDMKNDVWYDVELRVQSQHSELYVNGLKVASHTPLNIPLVYAFTGYDEKSKELVIKVVNCSGETKNMDVSIDHATLISESGKVIVLSSERDDDENSFTVPDKILPVTHEYQGFGRNFRYAFKPYSYTILRIRAMIK